MIFPFVGMLIPGLNKLEHQNKNISRIAFFVLQIPGAAAGAYRNSHSRQPIPLPPPPAVDACRHALPEAARPVSRFFLLRPSVRPSPDAVIERANDRPRPRPRPAAASRPNALPSLPPSQGQRVCAPSIRRRRTTEAEISSHFLLWIF